MRRSGSPFAALAASPVTVGAITVLMTIVTVFLAYNANSGLPFVSVYRVAVEVPNASRMLPNNEVRIGGRRVGVVESIEAVRSSASSGSRVSARLGLKLDQVANPLPKDSQFRVRYRSAFGLKYLEVVRGDGEPAPEGFAFVDSTPGADDPAPNTAEVVDQTEFDEIYNTFDSDTRRSIRTTLSEFGDAFAGRGDSLNRAVEAADPFFGFLAPVARTLGADATGLGRFISELADGARIVAPVAVAQAELFVAAAGAFAAFTADPAALREAISEGPETLETGIELLPGQQRFLAKAAELSRELEPGAARLPATLPVLNRALEIGGPVLAKVPSISDDLERSLAEIEELMARPATLTTIERLGQLFDNLAPTLAYVVPSQTVCNYWNYFWTFVPGTIADEDQVGWNVRQRALVPPLGQTVLSIEGEEVVIPGQAQNSIASYAGSQAAGRTGQLEDPLGGGGAFDPYHTPILHGNPYGPTGQDGEDCQAGQVGYALGEHRLPGQPASSPIFGVSDIPGSRGPTTLFLDQDGGRELRDTRVKERQP